MKIIIYSVLFFAVFVNHPFSQNYDSVIARTDNDIITSPDSSSPRVSLPPVASAKLKTFLVQKLMDGELDAVQMYKYIQTFRIAAPDNNYAFVTEINEAQMGLQFYVFYYNSSEDLCSDPVNIDGYFMKNDEEGFKDWNGKMVEKPIISFKDINGDGNYEIIFNRRAHNGTWNAVETIVLRTKAGAELTKWFSYRSQELTGDDSNILLRREIKSVNEDNLLLSVKAFDFKTGAVIEERNNEIQFLKKLRK